MSQPYQQDPNQPPYGYQPPPPGYPPQSHQTVSKSGISGIGHIVHLVLTICTCGAWGIIWFLHWLFTRNKTVTRG